MSAFQMLVSKHESLKPHFHHRHQGLTYVQINIIHHTAKINLPVQGMSFSFSKSAEILTKYYVEKQLLLLHASLD